MQRQRTAAQTHKALDLENPITSREAIRDDAKSEYEQSVPKHQLMEGEKVTY